MRTAAACMCGSKTVTFVGCVSVMNDSTFWPASIGRMSMSPVPIGISRSTNFGCVALRVELERDLEMAGRVLPVRVHVDVREADARAGAQQLSSVGIEDVGVAADFVHRPAADTTRAPLAPGASTAMMRVMEDEEPADGFAAAALPCCVVDFPDFDRRDVSILSEAGLAQSRRCPTSPGCTAFTLTGGVLTTRSGVPIVHSLPSANFSGGGMSAGLPRGAPCPTHAAILATSSSLREMSFL